MSEAKKPEGPPGGFQNPLVIWREKFGKVILYFLKILIV